MIEAFKFRLQFRGIDSEAPPPLSPPKELGGSHQSPPTTEEGPWRLVSPSSSECRAGDTSPPTE